MARAASLPEAPTGTPAPASGRPGREAGTGAQWAAQLRGVGWGARGGGGGRDPDTRRSSVGPRSVGGHCVRRVSGSIARLPLVPICRAEKLGRAVRALCPRKGSLTPFSQRVPGSLLPPSPLSARGLSGSAARVCPPPFPVPTPSANFPFFPPFSLLFGWVITGSSCQGAPRSGCPVSVSVAPPSSRLAASLQIRQDPGPCPPAGVISWLYCTLSLRFPFGPKLCPEVF